MFNYRCNSCNCHRCSVSRDTLINIIYNLLQPTSGRYLDMRNKNVHENERNRKKLLSRSQSQSNLLLGCKNITYGQLVIIFKLFDVSISNDLFALLILSMS